MTSSSELSDEHEVRANNAILLRIESRDQYLELRLNNAIDMAVKFTGILFIGILGAALSQLSTISGIKMLIAYMPSIGMFSVFIAWGISENLKRLTHLNLEEGRTCEARLAEKVELYARPFRDRDDPYSSAWSLDRMKAILLVIAIIWGVTFVIEQLVTR